MATYNKFNDFVEQLGKEVHDFDSDTLKVYLTNEQPLATDATTADIAGIAAGNGYAVCATTVDWAETGGTATLSAKDVEWTAAGGNFGPFQWAVLFNDSAAGKNLIAWWEYGAAAITVSAGEKFTVDFGASVFTIA